MSLIQWIDARFLLGVAEMDHTHREFVERLNRLYSAPSETFTAQFHELLAHTEAHFANEDRLMVESGFPAIREHQAEHRRVLAELRHFAASAAGGNPAIARNYLREGLSLWFMHHSATMDSALAGTLKLKDGINQNLVHLGFPPPT